MSGQGDSGDSKWKTGKQVDMVAGRKSQDIWWADGEWREMGAKINRGKDRDNKSRNGRSRGVNKRAQRRIMTLFLKIPTSSSFI